MAEIKDGLPKKRNAKMYSKVSGAEIGDTFMVHKDDRTKVYNTIISYNNDRKYIGLPPVKFASRIKVTIVTFQRIN